MEHQWIDEGLREEAAREQHAPLVAARERHRAMAIKQRAPELMFRLVSAVGAAVEEYRRKASVGRDEIDFEPLPRGSFRVTKLTLPSVDLECHPDYDGHVVYCNRAQTDSHERGARELEFVLHIVADDLDNLMLCHQNRSFTNVEEAAEFLLKPVLFPVADQL